MPNLMMAKLEKFQIFGERNTGTNYLKTVIEANFELIHTREFGFKHWFIKNHYPRGQLNQTTDNECLSKLSQSENTLFIFIIREPLSWLCSMQRNPYHAPDHFNLPFSQFIRKKWLCYERYCPPEYVPGKGTIAWYKNEEEANYFIEKAINICVLRTLKILHFLALKDKVKHFYIVRQEHLLEDLNNMAQTLNLKTKHPTNIILPNYHLPRLANDISAVDLKFIEQNLNLYLESLFGYKV